MTCVAQPVNSEICFDYDKRGELVCVTDALGNKMHYGYDERNQIVCVEDGNKYANMYLNI